MLDDGDAGHLDGAGAAPVGEPGRTRRGPAAHKPTAKPAKKQSPAPSDRSRAPERRRRVAPTWRTRRCTRAPLPLCKAPHSGGGGRCRQWRSLPARAAARDRTRGARCLRRLRRIRVAIGNAPDREPEWPRSAHDLFRLKSASATRKSAIATCSRLSKSARWLARTRACVM